MIRLLPIAMWALSVVAGVAVVDVARRDTGFDRLIGFTLGGLCALAAIANALCIFEVIE